MSWSCCVAGDQDGTAALTVRSFTLRFPTGSSLTVRLDIEHGHDGVEVVAYSFHFQSTAGSWRFCCNDHYVSVDDGPYHLHLSSGRRLPRRGPVWFDQIFQMVTLTNEQLTPP